MTPCSPPNDRDTEGAAHTDALIWSNRYQGLVSIACFRGKQVAGISGPWSGKFALTWWDRPLPQRQLELFDSRDQARREVEAWAQRMDRGQTFVPAAHTPAPLPPGGIEPSLLGRLCGLLPGLGRHKPAESAHSGAGSWRQRRDEQELDFGGLHFNAGDDTRRPA